MEKLPKYIQRQETRYRNNEFESMPSIDYRYANPPYLTRANKGRIDWDKVKEICDKYGFKYCLIHNTFGSDRVDFVLYLKTNITTDYYDTCRKAYLDNKDKLGVFLSMRKEYEPTRIKLHECVHELDEETDLMFDCGWSGNCGLFGSDDVYRTSYSGGDLVRWSSIIDWWSPCIHDTLDNLSRGTYVMIHTPYIKPQHQESPLMEDFEPALLKMVQDIIGKKYTAKFEQGKRQCDGNCEPYRALIVRTANKGDYCGMVTFSRDWMGRYHIKTAAPLAGESHWEMNWKEPLDDLKSAVLYFVN